MIARRAYPTDIGGRTCGCAEPDRRLGAEEERERAATSAQNAEPTRVRVSAENVAAFHAFVDR